MHAYVILSQNELIDGCKEPKKKYFPPLEEANSQYLGAPFLGFFFCGQQSLSPSDLSMREEFLESQTSDRETDRQDDRQTDQINWI